MAPRHFFNGSKAGLVAVTIISCASRIFAQAAPAPAGQTAVLTRDVRIKIVYGETVIPAGSRLPVVSADATTVRIRYLDDLQSIPLDAVRFDQAPVVSSPPSPNLRPQPAPTPQAPRTSAPTVALTLLPGWDTRLQSGSSTVRELQRLLSQYAQPVLDLGGTGIEIYGSVRYLMDVKEAEKALALGGAIPSRVRVATPGFPRQTLDCIGYDGAFEGHFNRLYLVTDAADKVVCLQFVDEHVHSAGIGPAGGWDTYDFVNERIRAASTARAHDESHRTGDVIQIETRLYDRERYQRWDEREETKLLIPLPFARVILYCIQNSPPT